MKKPSRKTEKLENGRLRITVEGRRNPIYFDSFQDMSSSENLKLEVLLNTELERLRFDIGRILRSTHWRPDAAKEVRTKSPPRLAENLFSAFAPKKSADAQLGDLQEIFQENVKRFGLERARRMYWIRISREIGPLLFQKLKRLVKRWGIIALLIDYGRTKLGF